MISITYSSPKRPNPVASPATFDGCKPTLQKVLQELTTETHWPVIFYGNQGRGKSCAAAVMYQAFSGPAYTRDLPHRLQDNHVPCVWRSASNAIHEWLSARVKDEPFFQWHWKAAPLAVLDDIGTRTLTAAQFDALLELVNAREGKPLIVTSNHGPQQLEKAFEDSRIVSRLFAGHVIELTGEDRRSETRKKVTA